MTRFDDELQYVCAWGRWRIGPALNEPMTTRTERRVEHTERPRLLRSVRRTRGRARLRLVASTGRPPVAWPELVR